MCYYFGQTLDNLSGWQEQPFFKKYAYNFNMLVNNSIEEKKRCFGVINIH